MKKLCLAMTAVWLASLPAPAAEKAGADPFNFLYLDGGARAAAMGGAHCALTGADALLYNPAGLYGAERHELTLMHNSYLQDITQEYAAYAAPWGLGLNLSFMDSGPVRRTTISNQTGAGLGEARLTDLLLGAGLAAKLSDNLAAGVSAKYIRENAAGVKAEGQAFDAGVRYRAPFLPGLAFGAAVQNVGRPVKFQGTEDELPLTVRLGASYGFGARDLSAVLSADAVRERSGAASAAAGVEAASGMLSLRLGYSGRNQAGNGLTAGAGLRRGDLQVDYAFAPFGALGDAHRLSVTFRLGGEGAPASAPAAVKEEPAQAKPAEAAPPAAAVSTAPAPPAEVPPAVAPPPDCQLEFSAGGPEGAGGTPSEADLRPAAGMPRLQARASSYIYEATPGAPVKIENLVLSSVVGTGEPVRETSMSGGARVRVYVWTRISSASVPGKVRYLYYLDGKKVKEADFETPGSPWAVWGAVTASKPGNWKVEVADGAGSVMGAAMFTVAEAPAPEPPPAPR